MKTKIPMLSLPVFAACVAMAFSGSELRANPSPAPTAHVKELLDPAAGQMGLYSGVGSLTHETVTGQSSELKVDASLCYVVFPGPTNGARRLLLVRTVAPQSLGFRLPPVSDAGFYGVDPNSKLTAEDDAARTDESPTLSLQLPGGILPSFELPPGGEGSREENVFIDPKVSAKLNIKVKVETQGGTVKVTRRFDGAKPVAFEQDGRAASLEAWSETHVFDRERKVLVEYGRELTVAHDVGDRKMRTTARNSLREKKVRPLDEPERQAADLAEKDVAAIFEDIHARKDPQEIYPRILAAATRPGVRMVDGLHDALLARFQTYRLSRERSASLAASAGKEAPDFKLDDIHGKPFSFREATKGKVVVLTFWGVGCGPCRKEAPYLSKLQEKYREQGLAIIAVNGYDEDRSIVSDFAKNLDLKQTILLMGRSVGQTQYGVRSYPTNFFISPEGKILHKEVGFTPEGFPMIEARVERMLAEAKKK